MVAGVSRRIVSCSRGIKVAAIYPNRSEPDWHFWRFGEWSRREPSDIDGKPERVSEREGANQPPLPKQFGDQRFLFLQLRDGLVNLVAAEIVDRKLLHDLQPPAVNAGGE